MQSPFPHLLKANFYSTWQKNPQGPTPPTSKSFVKDIMSLMQQETS